MKPDNVLKMPIAAPSFESLPATEKQRLTTFGDGNPPFPGYVFDFEAPFPRWVPGEGVEDAYIGRALSPEMTPARAATSLPYPAAAPVLGAFVYLTQPHDMPIVAAYASRERAERDVEMVKRATGNTMQIIELPLEA